ncbi:MAG TPA: family 1 glycosylhydrolase [Defluviitoga tunisiensis]|nr:family 1 glycosylhydrolase [Defluviitoga tunisiensis]
MKNRNKFLLGAATSAHQVEGNNINSDFWILENIPGSMFREPSLDAIDHYNQYKEDIKLLVEAGLNAYRFSIEWARIQPSKDSFNKEEIKHYRDVLNYCSDNGITPIVTLHHFSSPRWLISEGGWESEKTVEYFGEYVRYVVSNLYDLMPYICTINEANMGLQITKLMKEFEIHRDNLGKKEGEVQVGFNTDTVMKNYSRAVEEAFGVPADKVYTFLSPRTKNGDLIIMKCHKRAREVIKSINSDIKVGITFSLHDIQTIPGGEEYAKVAWEEDFLHYLPYIMEDDFLGVQNYTRKIYGPKGIIQPENARLTDMGYEFYPEALRGVLRFVSNYWHKPIMVTENGISTSNDKDRIEFIDRAINGLKECIDEGINVIGYMYWSLLDNFEWHLGYTQKFGLIAVDRKTKKRFPKESLFHLGQYAKLFCQNR